MRSNIIVFIFISLISLSLSLQDVETKNVDEHEWDILIFTQQWPVTVCWDLKKHHHTVTCNMPPKRDSWSIHGIWPTKLGTIGPGFCNRTWLFDPEQVRPIEKELMQLWTDIDSGSQHYSFWAHEWSKHGTCAAMLDTLNSEFKYFSKGLEWFEKYAMQNILGEADITPVSSYGYDILTYHNAIKAKLGVNPAIECRIDDGVSLIDEIRICFDKQLNPHDCDGIKDTVMIGGQGVITNCDPAKNVLYPPYIKSSMLMEFYKLIGFLKWITL